MLRTFCTHQRFPLLIACDVVLFCCHFDISLPSVFSFFFFWLAVLCGLCVACVWANADDASMETGHCRRRKIRCLLAPDDPHGRCSNCIRLKKECNFYPVDQQPETAKSSSEPGGLSASVAPVAHVPSTPQQDQFAGINNINQFPPGSAIAHGIPLRSNAAAGLGHSQPEGERERDHSADRLVPTTDFDSLTAITAQAYPYHSPQGIDPGQWAMPNYQGQPMGGDGSPAYWAQGQMSMPLQNTVSSVAGAAAPGMIQGSPEAAYGFQQQGEWAVPTRSMSYGHIENMPQYQQYVGQAQMGARTPTFPFVPTLGSNVEAMDVSSIPEVIPTAVHSPSPVQMTPQSYAYQQQAWDPYAHGQPNHMSDANSNAFAGQWQAPLGKVDEEGQQQVLAGQSAQPTYYSEPPNPG